jgi:hypothetical protein
VGVCICDLYLQAEEDHLGGGVETRSILCVYLSYAGTAHGAAPIDNCSSPALTPILLNEAQRQQQKMGSQNERIAVQAAEIRDLKAQQLRTQQHVAE